MKTAKTAADLRSDAAYYRNEAAKRDRLATAAMIAGNKSKMKAFDDLAEFSRVRARLCLQKAEEIEDAE